MHTQPHTTMASNTLTGTVWCGGVHNAAVSTVERMDILIKWFTNELIMFILIINY